MIVPSVEKKIFVVDDNETILVACKNVLKPWYTVFPMSSAAKMFDLLKHVRPDLILLDVEMPDMGGYEAAKILASHEAYRNIPFMFLTGRTDAGSEKEGLDLGALQYIHKPIFSEDLISRIKNFI